MPWTDEQVDNTIGILLRVGVSVAAVTVAGGLVWLLAVEGGVSPHYAVFRGEPAELRSVRAVVSGALRGRALNWIQLGILLLIATPVARVLFSIYAFAAQRDWVYVGITIVVFAILLYSLLGSAPA